MLRWSGPCKRYGPGSTSHPNRTQTHREELLRIYVRAWRIDRSQSVGIPRSRSVGDDGRRQRPPLRAPDDLLRRVLHFASAREAATTDALSRRWRRSLWRSSGAVNLEARLPDDDRYGCRDIFCAKRDAFVFAACKALELADDPITRLTFRVVGRSKDIVCDFLHRATDRYETLDVVADLLSHPAARRVEELQIDAVDSLDEPMSFEMSHGYEVSPYVVGIYTLSIAALPSETLRVLELTNCSDLTMADDVAFPRLESLQLRHCTVPLDDLQGVIDAAPPLATVHLDSVLLPSRERSRYDAPPPQEEGEIRFLRCPAATSLVLDKCGWTKEGTVAVEIYAPRLRRFRYKGDLREFSLSPPAPDLARVDLQFLPGTLSRQRHNEEDQRRHRRDVCARFWRFVHNFTAATELKLGVYHLEDIAVASEAWRAKLLPALRNLERLELEGVHRPAGKTAAVAIANLLRCCPPLRDLRLKLSNARGDSSKKFQHGRVFLKRKYRSDLEDSINRFKRWRSSELTTTASSMMEGDDQDDDDGGSNYGEVSDLPALSGHSFECLRSSLRRVGLQFRHEKTDCFGVKLIKFFAENAMVLQELCIDGGTEKIDEHMNPKVERWIANSCKRRRTMNSPSSTDFVVLPLKR